MLFSQIFFLCTVVPAFWAQSFIDEEGSSFVQLSVERNWNRGKVSQQPAIPPGELEDDIIFMQTRVEPEHRVKPTGHSYDVHHMAAGVSPEGDVDVVEEGFSTHRDRPSLSLDDAFSLIQTKVQQRSRDLAEAAAKVSLLQTGVQISAMEVDSNHRSDFKSLFATKDSIGEAWAEAATDVLLASQDPVKLGIAPPSTDDESSKITVSGILDATVETAWELRRWIWFLLCLAVLQFVVWQASIAKSKGLKGASRASLLPKRLSLTLPLRQFLDQTGDSVKISRSADGLAFVAKLVEDDEGARIVQLADAATPGEASLSIGPLPRSGLAEEGAAVHRHSTGCTLGSLKTTGPGSFSLGKNGQMNLCISSSAPFTLAMSINDREVAWVKPLSGAKEPDYVDLCFCEGVDSMLYVACTLAVLVAASNESREDATQ
jgi:hypothetical protein